MRFRSLKVAAALFAGATAVAVITVGPKQILGFVGRVLVVREPIKRSDAIVVLLGQGKRDRTDRAGELYREGAAPRVVFLEAYRDRPLFGMRDLAEYPLRREGREYRRALLESGVPESALVMIASDRAYDTATELSAVIRWMRRGSLDSVILVTSASHSRRVSLVWKRLAPELTANVVGAGGSSMDSWWRSRGRIERVIYEYGGLAKEAVRWILSGRIFDMVKGT